VTYLLDFASLLKPIILGLKMVSGDACKARTGGPGGASPYLPGGGPDAGGYEPEPEA
jgi:hypothetical protein